MKQEKISYKAYSFRLHEGTYKMLQELKATKGKSWNRLFYELIQNEKENCKNPNTQ